MITRSISKFSVIFWKKFVKINEKYYTLWNNARNFDYENIVYKNNTTSLDNPNMDLDNFFSTWS